jgi:hypothetical protein
MISIRFRQLAGLFLLLSLPHLVTAQEKKRTFHFSSNDVSTMVEESERVFFGEVVELQFVWREELSLAHTTDVIVRIIENIKGQPNAGANHVKFMIPGGKGVNPRTGEVTHAIVSGTPEFKEGEKVFMFLKKHPHLGKKYPHLDRPLTIPYDGLITGTQGKREVVDDMVNMVYSFNDRVLIDGQWIEMQLASTVKLPVDLVVKMAGATLKDAKAVKALDEQLRVFAKQPLPQRGTRKPEKAFLDMLEVEVDKILAKEQ